jgi:ankyrin repeat protein
MGLNATYERMLDRIDQHDRREAVVMLRWLSFAKHALTLGELQEARLISPDHEGSVAWDDPGSIDDIVEILGDLIHVEGPVEVSTKRVRWKETQGRDWSAYDSYRDYIRAHGEKSTGEIMSASILPAGDCTDLYNAWWNNEGHKFARVQLAHFSVKEYLISAHAKQDLFPNLPFHETTAQRYLAQSCLTYLIQYSKSNKNSWCVQDNLKYPLLKYAAQSWVSHADKYDEHALPHEISLLRDKKARSDWLRARYSIYETSDDALYCASSLAHEACVKTLLDLGEPVNAMGGIDLSQTALQVASEKGHQGVVQILLDAGADVNWIGVSHHEFYITALYEATVEGQEKIVEMLLAAGASIQPVMQPQCPNFGTTALLAASAWGHTNIARRLIAAGSDVNALGFLRSGGPIAVTSVLHAACTSGNDATVDLLIDAGADVNGIGRLAIDDSVTLPDTAAGIKPISTALLAAASLGYTKIVKKLIDAGADLDIVGCMQLATLASIAPTILFTPADQRPRTSVRTLVASALHAASTYGHEDIVRALLQGGATVNVFGYYPQGESFTALCAACEAGHLGIVIALLEAGAGKLDTDLEHRSPLVSAILGGRIDVVALLIKAGTDVNARAGNASALGIAAANGQVLIVEALSRAGALTGFDDYHGHTALMIASAEGHMDVVQALLDEAGGQPSAIPGFEQAIDLAAKEVHTDIEEMLLDQLMISQLQ